MRIKSLTIYQDCLKFLFNECYINTHSPLSSIAEATEYLMSESSKYDSILNYYHISKSNFKRWLLCNFLIINLYRIKSGIPVDSFRRGFINSIIEIDLDYIDEDMFDLFQMSMIFGDNLLLHNNAVVPYYKRAMGCMDDIDLYRKLCGISPFVVLDGIGSLAKDLDKKKNLFYDLIEFLVKSYEIKTFSKGNVPIPFGHKCVVFEYFDECYKSSSFDDTLRKFHRLEGMTRDKSYLKALMLEIFISTIISKGDNGIPLTLIEERLVQYFGYVNNASLESISKFYDSNEKAIIYSIMEYWGNSIEDEMMFLKSSELTELRRQYRM